MLVFYYSKINKQSNKIPPDRQRVRVHVAAPTAPAVGRQAEPRVRQHLRRPVQVLVRVPRVHPKARHHPPH